MEENTDQELTLAQRLKKNLENMTPEAIAEQRAKLAEVKAEVESENETFKVYASMMPHAEAKAKLRDTRSMAQFQRDRVEYRRANGLPDLPRGGARSRVSAENIIELSMRIDKLDEELHIKLDRIIELLEGGA